MRAALRSLPTMEPDAVSPLVAAVVTVLERERAFWAASQNPQDRERWRIEGLATVDAWACLAAVLGIEPLALLDAADQARAEMTS